MQRHPENDQHHEHSADAIDDGAVLNGSELFIGGRHRPRQPNACTVFAGEIEFFCRVADRIGGVLARLQRIEIEDRLEFDEGAAIGIGQRFVAGEFAP